jgi:hypothetical protein
MHLRRILRLAGWATPVFFLRRYTHLRLVLQLVAETRWPSCGRHLIGLLFLFFLYIFLFHAINRFVRS